MFYQMLIIRSSYIFSHSVDSAKEGSQQRVGTCRYKRKMGDEMEEKVEATSTGSEKPAAALDSDKATDDKDNIESESASKPDPSTTAAGSGSASASTNVKCVKCAKRWARKG